MSINGRYEIRLSGSGGQGLVLAGVILGEAFALHENYYTVQSQSYGPEARGGASKSDVVISNEEIDYPKAMKLDVLLALTQAACDKYYKDLKEDGILIIDNLNVSNAPDFKNIYNLPLIKTARDVVGREMVANIVSLGTISSVLDFIKYESIEKAVLSRVPKGTEELNKKALEEGRKLV